MFILLVAVFAFVGIAEYVSAGATQRCDEWMVRALRRAEDPGQPIGPKWSAEIARDLTGLGGAAVLTLMTAAILCCRPLLRRQAYGRASCYVVIQDETYFFLPFDTNFKRIDAKLNAARIK